MKGSKNARVKHRRHRKMVDEKRSRANPRLRRRHRTAGGAEEGRLTGRERYPVLQRSGKESCYSRVRSNEANRRATPGPAAAEAGRFAGLRGRFEDDFRRSIRSAHGLSNMICIYSKQSFEKMGLNRHSSWNYIVSGVYLFHLPSGSPLPR